MLAEIYDTLNIHKFLKEVKAKELKEAKTYGKEKQVKNMLESLGIDTSNADKHDFFTRMKIKMIGDI